MVTLGREGRSKLNVGQGGVRSLVYILEDTVVQSRRSYIDRRLRWLNVGSMSPASFVAQPPLGGHVKNTRRRSSSSLDQVVPYMVLEKKAEIMEFSREK
jgi:hypothetical protein